MRKKALIMLTAMVMALGLMFSPVAGGGFLPNDCGSSQQGGTCPPD